MSVLSIGNKCHWWQRCFLHSHIPYSCCIATIHINPCNSQLHFAFVSYLLFLNIYTIDLLGFIKSLIIQQSTTPFFPVLSVQPGAQDSEKALSLEHWLDTWPSTKSVGYLEDGTLPSQGVLVTLPSRKKPELGCWVLKKGVLCVDPIGRERIVFQVSPFLGAIC